MPGMSARQFEKDIRKKIRKHFERAESKGMTNAPQFVRSMNNVLRTIEILNPCAPGPAPNFDEGLSVPNISCLSLAEANRQHTQQVFPQAPHSHAVFDATGRYRLPGTMDPRSLARANSAKRNVTYWACPYCGADHDLAVKFCDCCGARRRREYVH